MDINLIIKDPYISLFITGLIFYLATVFYFIEKIEAVIKNRKDKHDTNLEAKYYRTKTSIKSVIEMFDSLRENRFQFEKIKNLVDSLHGIGVTYLSGCVFGFILRLSNLGEGMALALIGAGFLYFSILLIYLIWWYRKNKG